jgi:hypothetical protein
MPRPIDNEDDKNLRSDLAHDGYLPSKTCQLYPTWEGIETAFRLCATVLLYKISEESARYAAAASAGKPNTEKASETIELLAAMLVEVNHLTNNLSGTVGIDKNEKYDLSLQVYTEFMENLAAMKKGKFSASRLSVAEILNKSDALTLVAMCLSNDEVKTLDKKGKALRPIINTFRKEFGVKKEWGLA